MTADDPGLQSAMQPRGGLRETVLRHVAQKTVGYVGKDLLRLCRAAHVRVLMGLEKRPLHPKVDVKVFPSVPVSPPSCCHGRRTSPLSAPAWAGEVMRGSLAQTLPPRPPKHTHLEGPTRRGAPDPNLAPQAPEMFCRIWWGGKIPFLLDLCILKMLRISW